MFVNRIVSCLVLAFAASVVVAEEKTLIINDFENDADLKAVESGGAKLVGEGVTHGSKAMEIAGGGVSVTKPPRDWSAYDALILDVFNPADTPVKAEVMIGDKAWQDAPNKYWNRHNGFMTFGPGKSSWVISVRGMFRGEPGSRNNAIKRDIDPDSIVVLHFTFQGKVILDNLRLVKVERPKGVWAFDFGPASQAVALGWTAVSNKTKYDAKQGYGFGGDMGDTNARDTTFGPALIRDFVECGDNTFRVGVPEGKYAVTVIYENSGYWDGEQAKQVERKIEVDGKTVWSAKRADGAAHSLYRFENVEPIGVDIWDTYMAPELAKAETFEAAAGKEGLTLKFLADAPWGSRVSALVVHKVDDAEAAKWTKDQMADLAKQFRSMAVCLDKPAGAAPDPNTEAGLVWPVGLEQKITPNGLPDGKDPKKDAKLDMARIAVQGEYEPFCIAVRPAKDLGACNLRIEGGSPDVEAKIGVVWYGLDRGFGTAAYHVAPHTLRTQSTVNLPKGITREIVVTCKVSDQAKAGDVKMTLVVEDAAKKELIRVPMTLTVHAVRPEHKSDYTFGFFGMNPPSQIPPERQAAVMEDTMKVLKEHGMNGLSGGASFHFKGFKDGQPVIDFAQMDAFVELARKHGFTGPINGYGGAHLTGINDGYEVGDTGRKVAQDAGLPYEEVLMKVWKAVDEHARKADWPVILYSLCDETRVRDVAERELEFMNLMAKVSKAYPKTLRTSGMYSVDFKTRIADKENLLYWHQRFFEALDIGGLGGHDETVMTEAAKLGKEVSIYNQGHGRYPFGLYQWSEYRKGVKARWEWHLGIMHGYQFFDLDGREPDSQVIVYGRNGILPTMAIERCREGAEDFYLYQALWNLVQKGAGTEEARKKASALLEDVVAKMAISQRQPPSGFDADAFKAQVIAAIESLK